MKMMTHVTIIDRRSDRRIMGKIGARHNVCGGELTYGDLLMRDARAALWLGELAKWVSCPVCRQHVEHEARR